MPLRGFCITLAARGALFLALGLNPFLTARLFFRKADLWLSLACAGLCYAAINLVVPIALHMLSLPISSFSLTCSHGGLALVLLASCRFAGVQIRPAHGSPDTARWLLLLLAGFAILVLPFTYLAGVDTYKWQDLATIVRVEQRISWLVHPLSLFGFTPRSYPSAQPLLLATIQMLGGLGVDWGFYITSLVLGATGTLTAFVLGRSFFNSEGGALWSALLYTFSPVFMRYNHWATGRGLFVSLFPLYLLAILRLPRPSAVAGVIGCGIMLALAHKTGLIAGPLVLLSMIGLFVVPSRKNHLGLILVLLATGSASLLLCPSLGPRPLGSAIGFVRYNVARFAWMTPFSALGLIVAQEEFLSRPQRRLLPALFITFPLAHVADMYGALIALPFLVLAAVGGIKWFAEKFPKRGSLLKRIVVLLAFSTAVGVVAYRGIHAAGKPVRIAAAFLDAYDPTGPYMIESPARDQIQGYVAGCPRFRVVVEGPLRLVFRRLPARERTLRDRAAAWITFLRHPFHLEGVSTDWYGPAPRRYYVLINGQGYSPRDGVLIYKNQGVEIYEPAGQRGNR